jgi:hypothetical protein
MALPQANLPHARLERARQYKAEFLRTMFGLAVATSGGADSDAPLSVFEFLSGQENIVGLGFGVKITEGNRITDQEAVRVYVREKLTRSSLSDREAIPKTVNGLPTDVLPVDDLVASARPQPCGVSIGHQAIPFGTLGCLVRKNGDSDGLYILSNNHVLADCDRASIGDLILEPGPGDGGRLDDPIAELSDFEPIMQGNAVVIDAAIARLLQPDSVTKDIKGIGDVQLPPTQAAPNQSVLKCGRTTNLTEGRIVGLDEDVPVRYAHQRVKFEGQLAIDGVNGPFGQRGDSGALVVDSDTRNPVGLFFAAKLSGTGTAFANPIEVVLARFGIEIL